MYGQNKRRWNVKGSVKFLMMLTLLSKIVSLVESVEDLTGVMKDGTKKLQLEIESEPPNIEWEKITKNIKNKKENMKIQSDTFASSLKEGKYIVTQDADTFEKSADLKKQKTFEEFTKSAQQYEINDVVNITAIEYYRESKELRTELQRSKTGTKLNNATSAGTPWRIYILGKIGDANSWIKIAQYYEKKTDEIQNFCQLIIQNPIPSNLFASFQIEGVSNITDINKKILGYPVYDEQNNIIAKDYAGRKFTIEIVYKISEDPNIIRVKEVTNPEIMTQFENYLNTLTQRQPSNENFENSGSNRTENNVIEPVDIYESNVESNYQPNNPDKTMRNLGIVVLVVSIIGSIVYVCKNYVLDNDDCSDEDTNTVPLDKIFDEENPAPRSIQKGSDKESKERSEDENEENSKTTDSKAENENSEVEVETSVDEKIKVSEDEEIETSKDEEIATSEKDEIENSLEQDDEKSSESENQETNSDSITHSEQLSLEKKRVRRRKKSKRKRSRS
jgi:hypothetical protein